MTRASDDAHHRVEQLILLTDHLTELVLKEAECLRKKRPRELGPLQEEKARIAALYTREANALKRDVPVLPLVRDELKALLRERTDRMRAALETLAAALSRSRHVSEGIIRAIADDVNARQNPPIGYASGATVRKPKNPVSIALDRRI